MKILKKSRDKRDSLSTGLSIGDYGFPLRANNMPNWPDFASK